MSDFSIVPIDYFELDEGYGSQVRRLTSSNLNDLASADTDRKMSRLAAEWSPLLYSRVGFEGYSDEEILFDAREIVAFVLRLKHLIDNGACTERNLEEIGVSVWRHPGDFNAFRAFAHILLTSNALAMYLMDKNRCFDAKEDYLLSNPQFEKEAVCFCPYTFVSDATAKMAVERRLYLPWQSKLLDGLKNDSRCFVVNVAYSAVSRLEEPEDFERIAYGLIDSVISGCSQGLEIGAHNGCIVAACDSHFTSIIALLSESLRTSRVVLCKTCGMPAIAPAERGNKKQYCSDACKRKFMRAKKYGRLVQSGMDENEAAAKAGIAAKTAKDILARNGLDERSE